MRSRHFRVILFSVMAMTMALSSGVYAQDDSRANYENERFEIVLPNWMEVQEAGDDFAVFGGNGSTVSIRPVSVTEDARNMLADVGDDIQNSFLVIMQTAFQNSDHSVAICEGTSIPCVVFTNAGDTERIVNFIDPSGSAFYSLVIQTSTAGEMSLLDPNRVIASFSLRQPPTQTVSTAVLFNVAVTGSVNLRSCGSTACNIVGQASNDQVLEVIAQEDDWYEVKWEGGTAFIASWLTSRGPDIQVDLNDGYFDPSTGCVVAMRTGRGDNSIDFAISGEKRDEIWVDIYRPNDSSPVEVNAQYDKTFIDTDEPYIHQTYYWNTWWPTGSYRIELTLANKSTMVGFDITQIGSHTIYVMCE